MCINVLTLGQIENNFLINFLLFARTPLKCNQAYILKLVRK